MNTMWYLLPKKPQKHLIFNKLYLCFSIFLTLFCIRFRCQNAIYVVHIYMNYNFYEFPILFVNNNSLKGRVEMFQKVNVLIDIFQNLRFQLKSPSNCRGNYVFFICLALNIMYHNNLWPCHCHQYQVINNKKILNIAKQQDKETQHK